MEREEMKYFKCVALNVILLAPVLLFTGQAACVRAQTAASPKKQVQKTTHNNDGEQVFLQNCSRCHNTPDGFSPRISGSIVRHMRVRANLSEKDAQAVLRFFNP